MGKLNKMAWLEVIIGKEGIKDLYDKANIALSKKSKEILSNIEEIFYKDLNNCENQKNLDDYSD